MKHTDVLLGIGHPAHERDGMSERDQKEAKDKLIAIQELAKHPGWAYFVEHCRQEHWLTLSKQERCDDPTTLAKLVGVNLALESFPVWPEQQVAMLVDALKAAE